ncbi:MAG: PLP-dependent aminotransferase family protein [Opitutaceae bacterium]
MNAPKTHRVDPPPSPAGPETYRMAARTAGFRPSAIREILKVTSTPDVISFAGGLPAPELFPVQAMKAAAEAVLTKDGPASLQYAITEGWIPLREWVSRHLKDSVGLDAKPEEVLITSGSQQALDLVTKVLVDPGDTVLVENPAYLGALQAFQAYEGRVVGLPTDSRGMRIDSLRDFLKGAPHRPKFLYLVANFQNPTGTSTARERRLEISEVCAEFGVPIVEDDPYGRLRYSGPDIPALASLGQSPDCLYLGTASKILAPGLRVAWLVARDPRLHACLVAAKQAADLHTSPFTQRLVWQFLSRPGALDSHLGLLRSVYARRRDAMLASLRRHMPEGCSWTEPEGGLFLWVRLPERIDASKLLTACISQKVAFVPGEHFWTGVTVHNTLRLNFSNASEEKIEEGISRLGRAVSQA